MTAQVNTNSKTTQFQIAIEGISLPTIERYFAMLNDGAYAETASLFVDQGVMVPPFEQAVQGREAIAHYLETEAAGLRLYPYIGAETPLDSGDTEVRVKGKVDTSLFAVNVAWDFVLTPSCEIASVKVNLLAKLEELLNFRR